MAVALSAAAGSSAPAFAQPPLIVPYLPQSEALCGGAAAAMVMRFWGERDIYADAFAPLVDTSAGGIRTSALTGALAARGWQTTAGGGDLARLAAEIARGRPVIALIEDRPGRYHYVVVVAAPPGGPIVLHDPARAPSRAMPVASFEARWSKSDYWMLILQPGPDRHARSGATASESTPPSTPDRASGSDGGPRGLAEQAALEKNWAAAAVYARRAVERDPSDAHAWRILATAEYVRYRDLEALAAWNAIGEPRTDIVDIQGLANSRYLVVADAIGIEPGGLLTPDALRIAQQRVKDIPAVSMARVTFHPVEGGRAQVDATVVERPRAPASYPAWVGIGLGAAANSEVALSFANPSGGGDAVDVSWRWWEHRPRIAASYAAPGPFGVWRLEASRETQSFGVPRFEETRTRFGVDLRNWLTQRIRVTGGLAFDRWRDREKTIALSGRLEAWPVIDRLLLDGAVSGWRGTQTRFASATARVSWRSRTSPTGTVWLASGGYHLATRSAPASLWPGADTGHARSVLLRAHPLLEDGIIEGGVFGRRIAFAGAEAQHWLSPKRLRLIRIAPAAFVDVARAARGLPSTDTRVHYDAGVGVRLALLGFGVLRADVARGLRDGRTAFSIGWQR